MPHSVVSEIFGKRPLGRASIRREENISLDLECKECKRRTYKSNDRSKDMGAYCVIPIAVENTPS